jgi:hypothetical protein
VSLVIHGECERVRRRSKSGVAKGTIGEVYERAQDPAKAKPGEWQPQRLMCPLGIVRRVIIHESRPPSARRMLGLPTLSD